MSLLLLFRPKLVVVETVVVTLTPSGGRRQSRMRPAIIRPVATYYQQTNRFMLPVAIIPALSCRLAMGSIAKARLALKTKVKVRQFLQCATQIPISDSGQAMYLLSLHDKAGFQTITQHTESGYLPFETLNMQRRKAISLIQEVLQML